MNIREKLFHKVLLVVVIILVGNGAVKAQTDLKKDTIECHIVGFNVGMKTSSALMSFATTPEGTRVKDATMSSLYKGPFMEYGINALYKYKSNWIVTIDGNLWMGQDNLKNRMESLGSVYTSDSIVIGSGGSDADMTCFNRGFSVMGGFGKIFPLDAKSNPNSGIMVRANAGYMLQQTIFMCNRATASQLDADYGLLYDHQRSGFLMGQSIGYWFMSNTANLFNFYVELGVQQCWSRSTRDYVIDYNIGLQGPDHNRYFDLLYTFKFCWMFPLTGKQSHEYHYF